MLNHTLDQDSLPPILIVDDHAPQLAVCKLMLRKLPYPLLTALNVQEALVLLDQYIPALIILDVAMPGASGLDLLKQLRSTPRFHPTKVILATAVANLVPSPDRRLADLVLTKPFAYRDLNQAVSDLIGNKSFARTFQND